jgi:hypothetical protein
MDMPNGIQKVVEMKEGHPHMLDARVNLLDLLCFFLNLCNFQEEDLIYEQLNQLDLITSFKFGVLSPYPDVFNITLARMNKPDLPEPDEQLLSLLHKKELGPRISSSPYYR